MAKESASRHVTYKIKFIFTRRTQRKVNTHDALLFNAIEMIIVVPNDTSFVLPRKHYHEKAARGALIPELAEITLQWRNCARNELRPARVLHMHNS